MRGVFDFNIYNHKFNKDLGYGHYEKNGIKKLIIKVEKFGDLGQEKIGDFVCSKFSNN